MRVCGAGIDWGMREDAVEEDEGDESGDGGGKKGPSVTDKDAVHAKDMKLFERIETRRQKVANMNAEIERIRAKEMQQGGLSEGTQPSGPVRRARRTTPAERGVVGTQQANRRRSIATWNASWC